MATPELHQTLEALLTALSAESDLRGPTVVAAEVTTQMEVRVEWRGGRLRAFAAPPVSRWRAGVVSPVHRVRLAAEARLSAEVEERS